MKRTTIAILLLFTLGFFVRVFNFTDRVVFTLEQGITLSTTYDYLHSKFSLLGLPNVQRFTSTGLQIFSTPVYNYALMPVMKILGTNPVSMTITSLVINMLTAVLMYALIKQLSGRRVAFFSTLFFLFSSTMISQSLTLWILNPLPLIGLLGMYLLLRYKGQGPMWSIATLGILAGFLIALEWMCVFTAAAIAVYILFRSKYKVRDLALFGAGAAIPLLPTLAFDLRNDWYHFRTLWQYTLDTFNNPGQGRITHYHLFHLLPALYYILGLVTAKLSRTQYRVGYILAVAYLVYGTVAALRSQPHVSVPMLLAVSEKIVSVAGPNYNVVYMPDSEYRAYSLRYILSVIHGKAPQSVTAYPSSDELFVVADVGRSMDTDIPWEISSFGPKSREVFYASPDGSILLYKLTR